ncbi:MAG: FAD-dependent oxidoreductase [Robiginitomaculum sp.]
MDKSEKRVVIIGGGQAGFQAAHVLRAKGHAGPIDIIAGEPFLPYQRPPLSKAYLEGTFERERLFLRQEAYYVMQNISVHQNMKAVAIDKKAKHVSTDAGIGFDYDALILATGARLRRLPESVCAPKTDGVYYLKGIADVDALKVGLEKHESFIIIGGGFIGLESAATLTKLGKKVTVIEAQDSIIPGLSAPQMVAFLESLHRDKGAKILTGAMVASIVKTGGGFGARLKDGRVLRADAIIVGIGVIPNTDLGESIGIKTDRGLCVDARALSNIADVYAAGDCAHGINLRYGGPVHLESVQNAIDQAGVAAHHILGLDKPYAATPWFWSDQYHIKVQMVGLAAGYDEVVMRGDRDAGKFTLFFFKAGALICVHTANEPGHHMAARRILDKDKPTTLAQCEALGFDLKALMRA